MSSEAADFSGDEKHRADNSQCKYYLKMRMSRQNEGQIHEGLYDCIRVPKNYILVLCDTWYFGSECRHRVFRIIHP